MMDQYRTHFLHLCKDHWLWAWLPFLSLIFLALWNGGFTPIDDLSRHITAYRHGFDYSNYYLYSNTLTSVTMSPWFGFEWITGNLHAGIEQLLRILPIQLYELNRSAWALAITFNCMVLLALCLFTGLFVPIFLDAFSHHATPYLMTGYAITLMLIAGLIPRLLFARPEVFLMLGMFSAWRLRPLGWVILMMLLQPLYWLSCLYIIGILLVPHWNGWKKVIATCSILSVYIISWHIYCGLEALIAFFKLVRYALTSRLIQSPENKALLDATDALKIFWTVLIVMGFCRWRSIGLAQKQKWSIVLMMVFWAVSNQVRYFVYCVPCLVYLWAKQSISTSIETTGKKRLLTTEKNWLSFLMLPIILLICFPALPINGFQVPLFKALPREAKVLTFFNASTFSLPAIFPNVKVAPAMEIGFTNLELQRFLQPHKINQQADAEKLDCATLKKNFSVFTHVVDWADKRYQSSDNIPVCLQLEETHGIWRLWRIIE